jgi:hypothetical protein
VKNWIIVRRRGPGDPHRPWQLWRADGIHRQLVAERSTHGACVAAMNRLSTQDEP